MTRKIKNFWDKSFLSFLKNLKKILTKRNKKYRIKENKEKARREVGSMKNTNVKNNLNKIRKIQIAETLAAVYIYIYGVVI